MNLIDKKTAEDTFTFKNCVSLFFALFSLYLLGDVFYRWDAYRFHSSFSEYLPNVALAFIIWTILALLCSIFLWLLLKTFGGVFRSLGFEIRTEHLMLYLGFVILMAGSAWILKKYIWADVAVSFRVQLVLVVSISLAAITSAWSLRNKAELLFNGLLERIIPLIWLFAICLVLSLLLAGYKMWDGSAGEVTSRNLLRNTVSGSDEKRPNILLVTFDALTSRDMSSYGYSKRTTPFIDKWANNASLFARTKAGSNYTAATTPGLMTGKRTWTHRKYHHDLSAKPVKIDTENIALVMKENGYNNLAYIQNVVTTVKALGISNSIDIAPSVKEFFRPASFEGIIDKYLFLLFGDKFSTYNWIGQDDFIFTVLLRKIPQKVFVNEFPSELVFNKFLKQMDSGPVEPFFAWIHLMPPHAPQLPPPPFAGTFNQSADLREQNKQHTFNAEIVKHDSNNIAWSDNTRRKVALLRDYYDEFILYCDKQFENFINEIQKREWSKNTVIILSSDHGESFEHDYFLHKPTHLYEQVTHIPLIIQEPGQKEARVINDLTEQVDIPATILDLAGISLPSWIEGRSLLPLMREAALPDKAVISVSLYKNSPQEPITKGILAVWEGDYKLVHYLEKNKSLLFNLKTDPDELNNLIDKEPVKGDQLLTFLKEHLKEANERIVAEKQK